MVYFGYLEHPIEIFFEFSFQIFYMNEKPTVRLTFDIDTYNVVLIMSKIFIFIQYLPKTGLIEKSKAKQNLMKRNFV